MQVAAIFYVQEQNEPSWPLAITLPNSPAPLTRESVETSVKNYLGSKDLKFDWESRRWADLEVELGESCEESGEYLFISFSSSQRIRKALGLPE